MTAPALPKRANTELVAAAYLRSIVAAYDAAVGATLQGPDPDTAQLTWSKAGFVQLTGITGTIDMYVPMRRPVVSLDIYAANPGQSKRPPWGKCFALAELIVAASLDTATHDNHAVVSLPTGYPSARVAEFTVLIEPQRRPADPADYAHVGMDVAISWHPLDTSWTLPS